MVDPIELEEGSPQTRLESWLVRKIRAGVLRRLPWYYPIGGGGGCPESYAKALLAELQASAADRAKLERLKDDGRAFRSWAESALASLAVGGGYWGGYLAQGFAG
jgi:hypothetical protein